MGVGSFLCLFLVHRFHPFPFFRFYLTIVPSVTSRRDLALKVGKLVDPKSRLWTFVNTIIFFARSNRSLRPTSFHLSSRGSNLTSPDSSRHPSVWPSNQSSKCGTLKASTFVYSKYGWNEDTHMYLSRPQPTKHSYLHPECHRLSLISHLSYLLQEGEGVVPVVQ